MTPQEAAEFRNALRAYGPASLLALALWGEARGEPIEAQVGVGCVIRNRVQDRRWPGTYQEVILQPLQFSAFNVDDPNLAKLFELAGLDSNDARRKEPVLPQLRWVAEGITVTGAVDGQILDNVGGANHYYDLSIIVGHGQQRSEDRLRRYLRAVDVILRADHVVGDFLTPEPDEARDLIHTLVKDLPPKWDDEVLPVARKGRIVFFKL